jgi:hypothetical protein
MGATQQPTECLSGISADDPYYLIVRSLMDVAGIWTKEISRTLSKALDNSRNML